MGLRFVGASTNKVNHGSGSSLDNLTQMTILMWISLDNTNNTYRDFAGNIFGGVGWILNRIGTNGTTFRLARETTGTTQEARSTGVLATGWNFMGGSIDLAGGNPRLYRGSLTSQVVDVVNTQVAGTGANDDDSANDTIVGDAEGGFAIASAIAFVGIWNRQLTLLEVQAQQFRPQATSGCVMLCHYGLYGTATQPDWSGNLNNGTVTGATVADHAPVQVWPVIAWSISPVTAQTIFPNAIASVEVVYQPALTFGAITIDADAIVSAEAVHDPAVSIGPVTIAADAIASAEVVYQPALTFGAITIDADAIASAEVVYQPAVAIGALTIFANAIASAEIVHQPALTFGAITISPNAIASAEIVHAPALTFGAITISANAIASTETVYDPAVAIGAITISPDVIGSAEVVYAPALTFGAITITPDAIGSVEVVYAPFVGTGGAQVISPDLIASVSTVYLILVAVTVTPASRTFAVAGENRTFAVPHEDRTFVVSG